MLHINVGSAHQMLEIHHEEFANDSDDSDVMYVGSSMGPPRTAEEQKCTLKVEKPDSPSRSGAADDAVGLVLPPSPAPVVLFSALSPHIQHSTPQPSPVSPPIDDEKPAAVKGMSLMFGII